MASQDDICRSYTKHQFYNVIKSGKHVSSFQLHQYSPVYLVARRDEGGEEAQLETENDIGKRK